MDALNREQIKHVTIKHQKQYNYEYMRYSNKYRSYYFTVKYMCLFAVIQRLLFSQKSIAIIRHTHPK